MIVYRELSSIEKDLGVSAKTLYTLSNNLERHYHRVSIPKRSGGERVLSVPDDVLKQVQRLIADRILSLEPVSHYATAYKSGSSVIKNAACHVGKTKVLKLDIKSFFDSIRYSQVKDRVFPSPRFSEKNRILLAMLCYYKDKLPQGAPSSPIITNIIMREFDETVGDWCAKQGIDYTRYCDDMTFSGDFNEADVIPFVSEKLKEYGLLLNWKKTSVVKPSARQLVTGVVVNRKLNASSDYRKKLRQEVYYCRKYGVEGHLARVGCTASPEKYLASLLGRISFALQISPQNVRLAEDKAFVSGLLKNIEK